MYNNVVIGYKVCYNILNYIWCIEVTKMYLENIKIKNFKKIESMEIRFQKRFNLIIGDNSVGKTSILEAIATGLGGFIAGVQGIKGVNFSSDEIRRVTEFTGKGSFNVKYVTPVEVECEVNLNNKHFKYVRKKNSIKSSHTTVEPRDICKEAAKLVDDKYSELPVISYQSASRMWSQKKNKWNDLFGDDFSRRIGYTDCLDEDSNIKMMTKWCKRMEEVSWQMNEKIDEYESAKNAVSKFINIMTDRDDSYVFFDKRSLELMCRINNEELPLRLLSAGYRSMIGMVFDIAYRMSVLNPDMLDSTFCTKGIVLIDEIDLHLHPKWQWKVIEALEKVFPNVQFIATTHSPIILSSYNGEYVISINDSCEIEYRKAAYGYVVNDVLSILQDSDRRLPGLQKIYSSFYEAIDNEDIEKADKILSELKGRCREDDPDIIEAQTTIDLEKMDLD